MDPAVKFANISETPASQIHSKGHFDKGLYEFFNTAKWPQIKSDEESGQSKYNNILRLYYHLSGNRW